MNRNAEIIKVGPNQSVEILDSCTLKSEISSMPRSRIPSTTPLLSNAVIQNVEHMINQSKAQAFPVPRPVTPRLAQLRGNQPKPAPLTIQKAVQPVSFLKPSYLSTKTQRKTSTMIKPSPTCVKTGFILLMALLIGLLTAFIAIKVENDFVAAENQNLKIEIEMLKLHHAEELEEVANELERKHFKDRSEQNRKIVEVIARNELEKEQELGPDSSFDGQASIDADFEEKFAKFTA